MSTPAAVLSHSPVSTEDATAREGLTLAALLDLIGTGTS